MEAECQVLNHLQDSELITQRNISQRTGLSLGAVNILFKKWPAHQHHALHPNPPGYQRKTRLTYQFVRSS